MKNSILKIEHVNIHGEKMTLAMTKDFGLMFKHDDCNDKFENLKDIQDNDRLKYNLSKEEQVVFFGFIVMAEQILKLKS